MITLQRFALLSEDLCPACRAKLGIILKANGLLREEELGFVFKAPPAAVLTIETANEIGCALHRLIKEHKWPRRKVLNQLHHQTDLCIDRGLLLREADGEVLDFHENYLDQTFGEDGHYGWISSFANAAKRGLKKAPSKRLYERLARLQVVLRALGHL